MDEVNAIKWDPSGNLLASCSDDYTAKVILLAALQYCCTSCNIPITTFLAAIKIPVR